MTILGTKRNDNFAFIGGFRRIKERKEKEKKKEKAAAVISFNIDADHRRITSRKMMEIKRTKIRNKTVTLTLTQPL